MNISFWKGVGGGGARRGGESLETGARKRREKEEFEMMKITKEVEIEVMMTYKKQNKDEDKEMGHG